MTLRNLKAWSCVKFKEEVSDIGKEIIWNNTNIKINNKPFILCNWVKKALSTWNIYTITGINSVITLMLSTSFMEFPKMII